VKTSLAFASAFITLMVAICPAPAIAQFTVCNRTSQDKVTLAVAASWYDLDNNGNRQVDHSAEGWFVIAKGTCQTITNADISGDDMYLFAFSTSKPSIKWTGQYNYCMDPKSAFRYKGAQTHPPCATGIAFPTMYIETSGFSQFTYNLIDNN